MKTCAVAGCSCSHASSFNTSPRPNGAPLSGGGNPFCLGNFLAIGCIRIHVHHMTPSHSFPASDGHDDPNWYPFTTPIPDFRQHLCDPNDDALYGELDFLIRSEFIGSSYTLLDGMLVLRVYLIPYDLSNVQGRLRTRREEVVSLARRCLKNLLPRIDQDRQLWLTAKGDTMANCPLFPKSDSCTLSEIYSGMNSPRPYAWDGCPKIVQRLLSTNDALENIGMRSQLFVYQRRSVAAMLQQEMDTRDHKDPLYVELKGMDDKVMYFQPGKMELLQDTPMVSKCRGGILCEELGTGKTVMVLALILSTLHQISAPELSILDNDRPALTPIAFRHFPSSMYITARTRALRGKKARFGEERSVPTLVELLLHHVRLNPVPRAMERWEEALGVNLLPVLKANTPFFLHHSGEPANMERLKRTPSNIGPRVMYLTTATLLVVPRNLIAQWQSEIYKHVEIPLRVLVALSDVNLPRPDVLATEYDIVLMTYDKLSAEASKADVSRLHTWNHCQCSEFQVARVPVCTCNNSDVTPLLQIQWKRMVIDEGHTSGTLENNLSHFARLLAVERKWVVTGTPSKNLLGLSFGSASDVEFESEPSSGNDAGDLAESNDSENEEGTRRWTKHDAEDLRRLNAMLGNFISVPVFRSNPRLFFTHVTEALLDKEGPRPGSITVLSQIFQTYMIRHRIEEIEHDVILPPLTKFNVLLDLERPALRSLNSLQAILAINAVDSERQHQDYMFHPRNAKALALVVENMSQIMFWSADTQLYNTDELVRTSEQFFDRATERRVPSDDIALLTSAFHYVKDASLDKLWRDINSYEELPYLVHNMDEEIFQAWTRTPDPVLDSQTGRYMHIDRLFKLYEKARQFPLARKEQLVEWGREQTAEEEAYNLALQKKKSKSKNQGSTSADAESHLVQSMSHVGAAKVKEVQQDLEIALNKTETEESGVRPDETAANTLVNAQESESTLLRHSVLRDVIIGTSGSSKLNYILEEVQKYAVEEKFLIFSASPLTLAHVAEGLDLLRVRYLQFSTRVPPRVREQFVMTFETSDKYRVFLMELKHGARGLNLVSASRIIFCEPVWHADVESQAIKRAHRIGQTKPIIVKTLAIRGTAEEYMSQRRQVLKGSAQKVPSMTNEIGMRDFIAQPKFLEYQQTSQTLAIPFIPGALVGAEPQRLNANLQGGAASLDNETGLDSQEVEEPRSSPIKKRKVMFAD